MRKKNIIIKILESPIQGIIILFASINTKSKNIMQPPKWRVCGVKKKDLRYINFSLRGICAFHSYTHCKCQYFFHFWLIVSFLERCGGTIQTQYLGENRQIGGKYTGKLSKKHNFLCIFPPIFYSINFHQTLNYFLKFL